MSFLCGNRKEAENKESAKNRKERGWGATIVLAFVVSLSLTFSLL